MLKEEDVYSSSAEQSVSSVSSTQLRIDDEIRDLGLEEKIQTSVQDGKLDALKKIFDGPFHHLLQTPYGDYEESLLDQGLEAAATLGQIDILSYLLSKGAEITKIDTHTLASEKAPIAVFEVLLQNGWDVNARHKGLGSSMGTTTLSSAVDKRLIRWLLEHKADPSIPDEDDATPIVYAAANFTPDVVELMITYGGDLQKSDAFVAATCGASGIPMMKFLLGKGCDINAYDHQFNPEFQKRTFGKRKSRFDRVLTPLQWTISSVSLDRMRFLLEKGADPNARNYSGKTAWQIAERNHYREPMEMLFEFAQDDDSNRNNPAYLAALKKPSRKKAKVEHSDPDLVDWLLSL